MAEPIDFPERNGVRTAPEGTTNCQDLPVHVDAAAGVVTSCWRLSPAEIVQIARTGEIWLQVIGGHPPVLITGVKPIAEAARE